MITLNVPAILTDSYKLGHFEQYPPCKKMIAYGEFRRGLNMEYDGANDDIIFFGLDFIISRYIAPQWTLKMVEEAELFFNTHNIGHTPYPFPKDLFIKFINEKNGYFPVKICALGNGIPIKPHTPVYTIEAEGEYARLVTYLETLLTMVWYPTVVATLSYQAKRVITDAFEKSVDPNNFFLLESRLHDFGFRGVTNVEQATIGGLAHLLNFTGSDTMAAAYMAQVLNRGKPVATSIPATEHSVMMAWPTEEDAVQNMINLHGHSVFATVADTYNYDNFLNKIVPQFASQVIEKGGTWVIRPDSGDPVQQVLKALRALEKCFPVTINSKGFKVIGHAAVIQGDGINLNTIVAILREVMFNGYSVENVAFGMGAGLLQKVNRDTLSFATKLCYIEYLDGTSRDVMKRPNSDSGKNSLPGRLQVNQVNNKFMVYPYPTHWEDDRLEMNLLHPIYDNGELYLEGRPFDVVKADLSFLVKQSNSSYNPISAELQTKIDNQLKGSV